MKICPKCKVEHVKPGTFCSRTCANGRIQSKETNEKRSISCKSSHKLKTKEDYSKAAKLGWAARGGKKYVGEYTPISFKHCTHCNTYFTSPFNRSWCTEQCFLEIKRKNWQGNKQRYKNENFDSSWEVDLVKWFEEKNIDFDSKPKPIPWIDSNNKTHKYFPDFYLPKYDFYIDPKNHIVAKLQQEKLNCVSAKVNLFYGDLVDVKKFIETTLL